MYQTSLAMFYEAVCVGIDFNGNVNADYFQLPLPPTVSENPRQTDNKPKPKKRRVTSLKTGLAAQCQGGEWFHYSCVGLTPETRFKGKWYCPTCRQLPQ
ncbi:uncharacterized protein LOC104420833 isoform X1 [Eucalyptus grandis]|uniref:uncharacterized protein LOC104420833 isoform X1 n=1 Tax=Eucalyptus grandis TaxID=71139 RepID=UPI00192EF5FF|nr:uncharacterized protein LOC104420833 isoform X1 [Eucalyptus grandis]